MTDGLFLLQLPDECGVIDEEVAARLPVSFEQLTIPSRDFVVAAAREQVPDVHRVEIVVRYLGQLLCCALDATGGGLEREQDDGAQKSHGAGKRLRHGA